MAEWLRRLTRKPKVRTAVGSNPALDSLVAFRNSSPGRPEACEGNLVAAVGSCGGLMVTHPWVLLEISLSDFRRLSTLNMYTYLHLDFRKMDLGASLPLIYQRKIPCNHCNLVAISVFVRVLKNSPQAAHLASRGWKGVI